MDRFTRRAFTLGACLVLLGGILWRYATTTDGRGDTVDGPSVPLPGGMEVRTALGPSSGPLAAEVSTPGPQVVASPPASSSRPARSNLRTEEARLIGDIWKRVEKQHDRPGAYSHLIDLIQTSPATARERLLRAYACRLIPYVCAGDQALEDRGYLTLRGLVLGDADAFARIAALAALTGLSVAGSDELNPPYFAASLASHPSPADVLSGHSFRHRASQDPSLPEDLCTLLRSDAPDAVRSTALDAIEVMTTTSSLRQAYLAPLRMMLTGASSSAALPERALTLLLGFPADLSLPVVEELASRPGPLAPLALGTLASNGELRERHLPLIRAYALQSRSDPVFQGEGSLYYERAKHLAFQALASVAEKDKTPDGPSGIEAGLRRTADWTTVEAASNAAAKVRSKALVPALKSILNLDPPYEVQDSVCAALELSDPTYMGPKSLGLEMTRLNDKLAEMQPDDPARADLLVHAEALRRQFEDECKRRPMPTSQ